MSPKSKLLILAIASLVCSRIIFAFINDPEGPNLLIVLVLAAFIFALSLTVSFLARRLGTRILIFIPVIAAGAALFVFGGYDDSPGAQGLGVLIAAFGAWKLYAGRLKHD